MSLRLLLDEHFSPEIARQLRSRGHDVVTARERADLHGLGDRALLDIATDEGRAILTENVVDFVELHRESVLRSAPHAGMVFTSARRFSRTRRGIGRIISAIESLLADGPQDLAGQTWWLGT